MKQDWTRELVEVRRTPFPEYPAIVALIEGLAEGATRSDTHSHPWAEINVMLEGRGVWCVGDEEFEVNIGDAFLLLPSTLHHTNWPPGTGFRAGTVDFHLDPEKAVPMSLDGHEPGAGLDPEPVPSWLVEALSKQPFWRMSWSGACDWWYRLRDEQKAAQSACRGLRVRAALFEALARFADPELEPPEWELAERRGIERALRHLVRNMAEGPVTINEMARVAGMSRSKFAQVFHRMLGTPPHSYGTALRIWLAQSGLMGCKASAAMIAGWLGFSSPQHFSRAFKAATGQTPQEYRRQWGAPWVRESLEEPPKKKTTAKKKTKKTKKTAKKKAAKRRSTT